MTADLGSPARGEGSRPGHHGVVHAMWRRAGCVVAVAVCCAACSSRSTSASPPPESSTAEPTSSVPVSTEVGVALEQFRSVTALGDSVPYGTACDCNPYPQLSGADIAHVAAHSVQVSNDATPGYTTGNVVQQLGDDSTVIAHVEGSQVVMVEVGANDVAYSTSCGTNASCYETKLPEIEQNLRSIVQRLHNLSQDKPFVVVLLDYWSVWLGGQYAQAQGPAYVTAADTVTATVNRAIRSVADATGSIYVDVRTAFRGPDDAWDETHLLASDGDHPNAQGHERIAQAITHTISAK
jgi:lysophospholipase L1-like esterase